MPREIPETPSQLFNPVHPPDYQTVRHSSVGSPYHTNPPWRKYLKFLFAKIRESHHRLEGRVLDIQDGGITAMNLLTDILQKAHLHNVPFVIHQMINESMPLPKNLWPTFQDISHVLLIREEVWEFLFDFVRDYLRMCRGLSVETFKKTDLCNIAAAHIALQQHFNDGDLDNSSDNLYVRIVRPLLPEDGEVVEIVARVSQPDPVSRPTPIVSHSSNFQPDSSSILPTIAEFNALKKECHEHKHIAQRWHTRSKDHSDSINRLTNRLSNLETTVRRLESENERQRDTLQLAHRDNTHLKALLHRGGECKHFIKGSCKSYDCPYWHTTRQVDPADLSKSVRGQRVPTHNTQYREHGRGQQTVPTPAKRTRPSSNSPPVWVEIRVDMSVLLVRVEIRVDISILLVRVEIRVDISASVFIRIVDSYVIIQAYPTDTCKLFAV